MCRLKDPGHVPQKVCIRPKYKKELSYWDLLNRPVNIRSWVSSLVSSLVSSWVLDFFKSWVKSWVKIQDLVQDLI